MLKIKLKSLITLPDKLNFQNPQTFFVSDVNITLVQKDGFNKCSSFFIYWVTAKIEESGQHEFDLKCKTIYEVKWIEIYDFFIHLLYYILLK